MTNAIVSDLGADSFTIQRMGIVRNQDEADRQRNNPRVTLDEARAIRKFATAIDAVMAQAQKFDDGLVRQRRTAIDSGAGRQRGVHRVFDLRRRARPHDQPDRDRAQPAGRPPRLAGRPIGCSAGPIRLEKFVKIAGFPFIVVGVSAKKGAVFGNSLDEFVVIPLGQYQKLFGSRQSLALMVKPRAPQLVSQAKDEARAALRIERRLKARDEDNFGIVASDSVLDIYKQATAGIFAVLVGIVALSLVVGGIVIMNIMLMVVSERTREIGLRKALGAKRRDIMSQVLTESITLSLTGGVVGIAIGALFARGLSAVTPLPASLELWSVALGVVITGLVGLFFGWYPARRAAMLDPIEALRRE